MMYILLREIETQNRNYWICNDCGNKFRNTEDWHEEIKKKEQAVKVNLVLTIFFIIVAMLLFTGGKVSSVVGIVFLIIGAVNAITFFLGKTRIRNELQHLLLTELLHRGTFEIIKMLKFISNPCFS